MDGSLKFDDMVVDTKLAETYFKEHNFEFGPLGLDENDYNSKEYFLDSHGNKIFCFDGTKPLLPEISFLRHYDITNEPVNTKSRKQLYELAKKIEENAELFSQLDYLIRSTPKDDVKSCDIKLISQKLLYSSSSNVPTWIKYNTILMKENTPLADLGFIAHMLGEELNSCIDHDVKIMSGPETAIVCYLFTQLCHEVGLHQVKLYILNKTELYENKGLIKGRQPGGMGIITERSDVDSAVDTFLSSSTRYEWSLCRILIQESVYEQVKKIFAWKCKNSTTVTTLNALEPVLKPLCTELFLHGEMLLLFDYVGDRLQTAASQKQVITVEAYRTTKDLLSLIKTQNPFSISLWSSDISEANEIAFGSDVNVVWVNDFGVFQGPPAVSHAFFSEQELKNTLYYEFDLVKFGDKFLAALGKWSELSVQMRIENIIKVLAKFKIENKEHEELELVSKLEDSILNWKSDNFVDVQGGKFCVGRVVPLDLSVHVYIDDCPIDSIMNMINGQGVLTCFTETKLLQSFAKEGLPVYIRGFHVSSEYKFGPSNNATEIKIGFNLYRTKVVWTNFGTIFAN